MNKDLIAIFEYLEREKGIKRDVVVAALEESLKTAARKSVKGFVNVTVTIHPKTGDIEVLAQKEVVDKVNFPEEEISLEEARAINPQVALGEWVDIVCTPRDFGRIAAQTARQVIAQKLRSAEKEVVHEEYRHRIHEIISGTVKRIVRSGTLIVDLGKVEGVLPERFYPKTEKYNIGDRVQALLLEVRETEAGGAEVILTRSHPEFVVQLFRQEVPEIEDGTISIERVVREAGYRTKLAVRSHDTNKKIDPVGACVGVRGTRVKNIIRELNEKIDIFPFVEDPVHLLSNALSPIEIRKINISEDSSSVHIVVDDEQYAAALGKRGLNARLNGQIIGADLHIQKMSDYQASVQLERQKLAASEDPSLDKPLAIPGISGLIVENLVAAGFDTARKLLLASLKEIAAVPGISIDMANRVLEEVQKQKGSKIG